MERHYDFDLTYITERIISVFFPPKLEEQRYRLNLKEVAAMLKSKHQDKFLVRKHQRSPVSTLQLFFWYFSSSDTNKSYNNPLPNLLSARFIVLLSPSNNRSMTSAGPTSMPHHWIRSGATGLLSDKHAKFSQAPNRCSSLVCIISGNKGKTGVIIAAYMHYNKISAGEYKARHYLHRPAIIPHLLSILTFCCPLQVKCYHRRAHSADRDTVFRLQFHTCTIHGSQLWFGKGELDEAFTGREYHKNDPAVIVDYNTSDPVVRWDSYENFNKRYQDSLEDIAHTRGPVDGSLYAQIKKRRGPSSGSLTSTNGSSPGGGPTEDRPDHLIRQGSDSGFSAHSLHLNQSSIHPDHPEELVHPPPPTRQEREELERLLGGIEGNQDGERETAILDDGDSWPSERTGTLRLSRSCSCRDGYRSQRCAEPGCDRTLLMPNGYCLDRAPGTNGHHGATPSPSPNPASPPSHMDMCQHYSPHAHQTLPPPDLVWDRQSGPPHYLPRSCSEAPSSRHICPYPSPDLTPHPHNPSHQHPISAAGRFCCREDAPFHHPPPPHSQHHTHSHHPKPSTSPTYHDIMLMDNLPPPGCPCRDCSIRREDSAAYHNLRLDRGDSFHWDREAELQQREARLRRARETELTRGPELHWERDPGLRRGRELSLHWERDREVELQWERDRETEYWNRRATVASYGPQGHDLPAFSFDPLPSGHPAYPEASRSHAHSHLDLKYSSSSSGYQTPHQVCPCSPYQPSPSESRGYASGYQSESTSPLPPPSSMVGTCSHSNGPADHNPNHHHHHADSQQSYSSDSHTDGLRSSGESVGWRDHITHGSFRRVHRDGHVACSTPSDMSGPPTPVLTRSKDYDMRTTDIIGSDNEGSTAQELSNTNVIQESPGRPQPSTKQASLSPTKADSPQTDPPPSTAPQPHFPIDAPSASSFESVTPTPTNQEQCQLPSSTALNTHSRSVPLNLPPLGHSEAAAVSMTLTHSQTETQANGPPGLSSAHVNGSSPPKSSSEAPKPITSNPISAAAPSSPQPGSSSVDGSPVSDAPVPGFATLGRRLMLSGSEPHHPNYLQHHGPPHHHYTTVDHSAALDANKRNGYFGPAPHLHPGSYSNYSTISIPLPQPQPPLPEKRHQPAQLGAPSEEVRAAVGHVPPSTMNSTQHQHHVTFSPTVGEIAPSTDQNEEVEGETANRVSVKFVQDSSRFWYKPGISREQGKVTNLRTMFV
ncbi:hypothetical protein GOODEAATRI_015243 [Goodea atripinnis]|uniref:C2 tensin-type domain-containing protein n=1 Tax=Goodea atripinnis TaxID=208336 RepID=A0ABV0PNR8_9TELE